MTDTNASSGLLGDTGLWVDDHGGSGRPVLLIHGWPLSGASWADQVDALKDAGYRVVTYDRRGFGRSDKVTSGFDYDTLTADTAKVVDGLGLTDVTLVGFSMGGGEVARWFTTQDASKIHSVVFAAAVPPYLAKTDDNPDGPLDDETAEGMESAAKKDLPSFYDDFITNFYSVDGELKVTAAQHDEAVALAMPAQPEAVYGCMEAFATTDFRDDLPRIAVPTLVIHGDGDAVVPFEGSGKRTHEAVAGSELHVVEGGPHGINVADKDEFNRALVEFLAK